MTSPIFEICVEGVDGAVAAEAGGGDRVELCASLAEGGITPSLGTVRAALQAVAIPVYVMVRPRGGDFLYSARESASMLDDVAAIRDAGAAGVVFGCLTADGAVDEARTAALVARARPAGATFHRAFDMTADAESALEALIRCGVDRVLTSGHAPTALEGIRELAQLGAIARGRIIVMGCGGLRPEIIGRVRAATNLPEYHFSALKRVPSGMRFRNPGMFMGSAPPDREFMHELTDPLLVRATIAAAATE
jgi:copper homeostasis protein